MIHCRTDDDGTRWIEGIIVPWNERIQFRGRSEVFAPGAMRVTGSKAVPLRYQHRNDPGALPVPVGVLHRSIDIDEGLWGEFRMFTNANALSAWESANAGIDNGFSAEWQNRSADNPGGTAGQGRVSDAVLVGAALLDNPAYKGARVTNLRARTPAADAAAAVLGRFPVGKWG